MRTANAVLLALLWAGCAGSVCEDRDLDEHGPGCALGPDCDDANAARNVDCESVPPPDCAIDPRATGCPCLVGSSTDCFPGGEDVAGIGLCRAGRTRCVDGHWGLCDGSQGPRFEICDELDQDCDGLADEGVQSPCGGCTSGCNGGVWGDGAPPFEASDTLALTELGELTLARREIVSSTIWVANSAEGTLSRIDAASATETARYATGGLEPSRVAVDHNGDAWVANREFDGVSTVVRVAGDRARCVDRDLDGALETSDGPEDVRAFGGDECMQLFVPVGAEREIARAMAIDGDRGLDGASGGDAWVGLHDGHAVVELDGFTGAERRRVEIAGFAPYAAQFDPWGILWMASRDGQLARIDDSTEPPSVEVLVAPLACWLFYSLAIDASGRIALTGFSCDQVVTYDPITRRWDTVPTDPSPRGAIVEGATLWIAHTGGFVSELSLDPLRVLRTVPIALGERAPRETVGMAADSLGNVWAISSRGDDDERGFATRIDAITAAPEAEVRVGHAPHTQGDLSGVMRFGELVREGSSSHVFEGCGSNEATRWLRVHTSAYAGTRGHVRYEARHAATREGLASASFVTLGTLPEESPPWELSFPEGGVIELRLTLTSDAELGAPRVRRVGLEWQCPGPV